MTFKTYLLESDMTNFHAEIDNHIGRGMIPNPTYQTLKSRVDRHIENLGKAIFMKHAAGQGDSLYKLDPALDDLAYATPGNTHEVLSIKNKLAKVKVTTHPLYKDMDKLHQELRPLAEKMKHLKSLIVKTTELRAAAKVSKEAEHKKKYGDNKSLTTALTTHLEDFKSRAHEYAGDHYDRMMKHLETHGWDIDIAAPKGHSRKDSRLEYKTKNARRNMLLSLTDPNKKDNIRKPSKKIRAAFQEQNKQAAHDEYMAWVDKMTHKIGKPVAQAKMSGSPWTGSRLNVIAHDGEEQNWNTKMIINYSKYNKMFNQFPTRKLK